MELGHCRQLCYDWLVKKQPAASASIVERNSHCEPRKREQCQCPKLEQSNPRRHATCELQLWRSKWYSGTARGSCRKAAFYIARGGADKLPNALAQPVGDREQGAKIVHKGCAAPALHAQCQMTVWCWLGYDWLTVRSMGSAETAPAVSRIGFSADLLGVDG